MKELLYCIFRQGDGAVPQICRGVHLIEAGGLAAAAADCPQPLRAGIAEIRAYEGTVEAFHQTRTLIPLRFGCLLPSRAQVSDLLGRRRAEYQRLLHELEGRVEMGLRLLIRASAVEACPATSGTDYLNCARRRRSGLTAAEELWTDRLCLSLRDLPVRWRKEAAAVSGGRLVSLYFLVPGSGVKNFRRRVAHLPVPPGGKVLASGPWPPYNFVEGADD